MNVTYGDVHIFPENDLARKCANVDESYDEPENDHGIGEEEMDVMMTTVTRNPKKDIGTEPNGGERGPEGDKKTDEEAVLNLIRTTVGTSKVNRRLPEVLSSWIMEKSLQKSIPKIGRILMCPFRRRNLDETKRSLAHT